MSQNEKDEAARQNRIIDREKDAITKEMDRVRKLQFFILFFLNKNKWQI